MAETDTESTEARRIGSAAWIAEVRKHAEELADLRTARDAALADAARLKETAEKFAADAEPIGHGLLAKELRSRLAALAASPSTAWLEAKVREAKVAALREAADMIDEYGADAFDPTCGERGTCDGLARGIRHKATAIEAGTTGEP